MLGQPALLVRHHGRDAQGEALLAEQGVAAVARAERPDLARLREVRDRLALVAGPRDVRLAGGERRAERVHAGHELAVVAELRQRGGAHARHHAHRDRDVGRVGQLHADVRDRASPAGPSRTARRRACGRASRRRTARAARRASSSGSRQLLVGPASSRARAADERAVLDARDVAGIGARPVGVGPQLVVQARERARCDEAGAELLVLLLGAVAPVHALGLEHGRPLLDPRAQRSVRGRCRGRCSAHELGVGHAHPPVRIAIKSGR